MLSCSVNKQMIFGTGKAAMDEQRGDSEDGEELALAGADDIDIDKLFPEPRVVQERLNIIRQRLPAPDSKKKPN